MNAELTNRAVRNMVFSGTRLVITAGTTVCTSAIIARMLGPGNMGLYSYAMWAAGTLGIMANIGLPSALTKYISEFLGKDDRTGAAVLCKKLLRTQVFVASGVCLFASLWCVFKPSYRGLVLVACAMILAQALQQSFLAALAGLQRFDKIALISLYTAIAQIISVGIAAIFHLGVVGMLLATLVAQVIGGCWGYVAIKRLLLVWIDKNDTISDIRIDARIKNFSLAITYILLLDAIVWQRSEVLFLKHYSSLAEIAFYALAFSIAAKASELSGTLSNVLLPIYSESYGRKGLAEVGQLYHRALKSLQMGMVFPCLLMAAASGPLVQLIYGSTYSAVALPLQLLLLSLAITSVGVVGSPLLIGIEEQAFMAKYGTIVAILNIGLDFAMIPYHGALGAAIANCTAQLVGVAGGTTYLVRHTNISFPWKSTGIIYCSAIVAVAPAAYALNAAPLNGSTVARVLSVIAAGVIYVGMLMITRQFRISDLHIIRRAMGRGNYSKLSLSPVLSGE